MKNQSLADLIQEFIQSIITWVSGSNAAGLSFTLNILMFGIAIWSIIQYKQQKKEYKLLSGILTEYGLKQQIESGADKAKEKKEKLDHEVKTIQERLEKAEEDLSERLPVEAKRAYYANTIPVVHRQIMDLSKQLESMQIELSNLDGTEAPTSTEIEKILSEEVLKHVSIGREMDKSRTLLAIYTGSAAAAGAILPYPLTLLIAIIAVGIVKEALKLYKMWKQYYKH